MTQISRKKTSRPLLTGLLTLLIIALSWSAGEALVLPYWPEGDRILGVVGWTLATFGGCWVAQARAWGTRYPYPAERVALAALLLALAGDLAARWLGRDPGFNLASATLHLVLAPLALLIVARRTVRLRRTGHETLSQRAYYFGEAVLKERE